MSEFEPAGAEASECRRLSIDDVISSAAMLFGVRRSELQRAYGDRQITHIRQMCVYIAYVTTGQSNRRISEVFGMTDRTSTAKARKRISDQISNGDKKTRSDIDRVIKLATQLRAEKGRISSARYTRPNFTAQMQAAA